MLLIGPDENAAIKAVIEHAEANPIPWEAIQAGAIADSSPVLRLVDRVPGTKRPQPSKHVLIPVGYRVAFSFEYQPAGLLRHISITEHEQLPSNVNDVAEILRLFGFSPPPITGRVWAEEYRPGHLSLSLVEIVKHHAN